MHFLSISSFLLSTLLASTIALPAPTPQKSRYTAPLRGHKVHKRQSNGAGEADDKLYGEPIAVHWTTPVTIGGYTGNLLIDSGSSDLWVYGPNAANPYNQAVYFGTAWQDGQTFNIQYVSQGNFASGSVVTDSVTVAGVNVPDMSVEVADNVGPALNDQGYDGILGLGIGGSTIGPNPNPTFLQMIQGNGLDNPIFAVNLKNDNTGVLDIGDIDTSAFVGDLAEAPIDPSTGFWQLDSVTFDFGDGFSQSMIVDTGSVATTVDPSIAAGYWSQVSGAVDSSLGQDGSAWVFPCGAPLPDFNMYVNGWTVTLPGGSLAWSPTADDVALCQGGLQGGAGTGSMGAPFFLGYYVVFNAADPSLQWGAQA